MRFTVDPAWDLEVAEGVTLSECRSTLAELAGIPADAHLAASGVPVRDSQVAGVRPWVAGSRLTVTAAGGRATGTDEVVGRPRWHVAVVAGPDAGATGAPAAERLLIGRGCAGPGTLDLHDLGVSRRPVLVRRVGRRWLVRRLGGTADARRVRRGRTRRLRRGAFLRVGDRLVLGASTVQVRRAVAVRGPGAGFGAGPAPAPGRQPGATPGIATLVVPLVIGLTLAAITHSPVYLLLAVAGPATTGLPLVAARLRRRRPAPAPSLGPEPDRCRSAPPHLPPWWEMASAGLAVVGPDDAASAAVRALVGGALLHQELRLALLLHPEQVGGWTWCRWLERRLGPACRAAVARDDREADMMLAALEAPTARPGSPLLVVAVDRASRVPLERWSLRRRGPTDGVIVVAASSADAPPWCAWTLTVRADGTGVLTGPESATAVTVPLASLTWAESHARAVAARDAAQTGDGDGTPDLPAMVGLAALGLPGDVAAVRARWAEPTSGLAVPVGVGPGGVVTVDLRTDGPHALVAGTTGAGKSELVQALVLGLALAHPPDRLAMVLLDFKGGAGVGPCADLPHVVGNVTDLDPAEAGRALDGLRAELRRREAALAAVGASDVSEVPHLPRLLVVVDEFQALTEDLPDFVPGLVRLAAQGRSLGFHLVLATQRPGGAVSPQMRANLALRICLRVMAVDESTDVVDSPAAAMLPADRPGRAVLRRGPGPVEVFQAPWAALPPSAAPVLRLAPDWVDFGSSRAQTPPGGTTGAGPPGDNAAHLVDVVRTAAGTGPALRLWSPRLPADVRRAALTRPDAPPPGLVLGVTDPAGSRAHGLLTWSGRGVLAVVGANGSGRSTAVVTVLQAALADGQEAHLISGGPLPDPALTAGLGTVVTADDPRRVARLLALLTSRPARQCLVAVDDVASVLRALEAVPRGLGTDLLHRTLRDGPHNGIAAVVAGGPRDLTQLVGAASQLLVLPVADGHDDVALGVPAALAGPRRTPGRAISLRAGEAVRCQVARPDPPPDTAPDPPPGAQPAPTGAAPRLAAIPLVVEPPGPGRHTGWTVAVGLGGDDAGPVLVDVAAGLLVVGPCGSGRSTALATVVTGLLSAGRRIAVVAADGPLAALVAGPLGRHPGLAGWTAGTPAAAAQLVARCAQEGRDVLVVDDADQLGRADPDLDDALAGWVLHRQTGAARRPALVAAARTDRAAAAYRGVCAALRGAPALVLAPLEPGSCDVAGADLALGADPARPRHPGRGVVASVGVAVPVQVTAWRTPPPGDITSTPARHAQTRVEPM